MKSKILIAVNNCSKTGGPILAYNIGRWLKKRGYQVLFIVLEGGEYFSKFEKVGKTIIVKDKLAQKMVLCYYYILGARKIICNTIVTGDISKFAKVIGYKVTSLIHELTGVAQLAENKEKVKNMLYYSDNVVFSSYYVRNKYVDKFKIPNTNIYVFPQGLFAKIDRNINKEKMRAKYKLRKEQKVIVGAGSGNKRKGFDLFSTLADKMKSIDENYYFIWVGDIPHNMRRYAHKSSNFETYNFTPNYHEFLVLADTFLLTSREDPFPSVVLDAIAHGKPVVGFKDAGGFCEISDKFVTLVEYLDCDEMIKKILEVNSNDDKLKYIDINGYSYIRKNYNFSKYMLSIRDLM